MGRAFSLRENLIASGGVLLLVIVFFFTAPPLSQTLDYVLFYQWNFRFLSDALQSGQLPLWNPYIGLGRPFLADIQNACFYPPAYLIGFGGEAGLFLFVYSHCLLAFVGMRSLSDALQISKPVNYLITFSFLASAGLTSRFFSGQILYAAALCYLPLLFHFANGLEMRSGWRFIAGYTLSMTLQFLCGHPQIFWISFLGQTAFLVTRSFGFSRNAILKSLGELLRFSMIAVWSVGLLAVSLLPFLVLIEHGNRAEPSMAMAAFGKMDWADFLTLFTVPPQYTGWEKNIYIGIALLIPGLIGLLRIKNKAVRGLWAVLVLAVLVAACDETPAFPFFFHYLPGFSSFRVHARAAVLVAFVLLLSAGVFLSHPPQTLIALWKTAFASNPKVGFTVLAIAECVNLLLMNWQIKMEYGRTGPASQLATGFPFRQELVAALKRGAFLKPSQAPPRVLVPRNVVPANAAMADHFSNVDAYTSLFLRRPWDYLHRALGLVPSEQFNTFLPPEVYERGPLPYSELAIGYDLKTKTFVANSNPFPRAFLVYGVAQCKDYETALRTLTPTSSLSNIAIVESAPPHGWENDLSKSADSAQVSTFALNEMTVDFNAPRDALLVISEAWHPGWRCRIDGKTTDAIPANVWMRGFFIPVGKHSAKVFYQQKSLRAGIAISSLSWLLLCLAFFVLGHRPKQFQQA